MSRAPFIPAALPPDSEAGFLTGCFLLFLALILLIVGWATRTRTVLWLSVDFAILAGIVGAAWATLVLVPAGPGNDRDEFAAVFRVVVFFWVVILGLAIVRLRKTPKREVVIGPSGTTVESYNRDWILSLLQSRLAAGEERVATSAAGIASSTEESPGGHGV